MSLTNSPFWFSSGASAGGGAFYPYSIDQSLRFEDGDTAYLSRTPSSASNRKTWTWSGWVKRGNLSTWQTVFSAGTGSDHVAARFTDSTDKFQFYNFSSPSYNWKVDTVAVFRDVSAWYHLVLQVDSTQATSTDRLKIYINGERQTLTGSYPSLNFDSDVNSTNPHKIGVGINNNFIFDGYMAEVNFIDGTALDATSFGETINGIWMPKAYDTADGAYGTNGFYFDFSDNSTASALGTDSSGNGNNFSVNNLATSDQVLDSPTNNWSILEGIQARASYGMPTLSEGNLQFGSGGISTSWGYRASNMEVSSGKWYAECRTSGNYSAMIGVFNTGYYGESHFLDQNPQNNTGGWMLFMDGATTTNTKFDGTTAGASFTDFNDDDIMGIALDADNKTVKFYVNGTLQTNVGTGGTVDISEGTSDAFRFWSLLSNGITTTFRWNFGQDSTFSGTETAGGNADDNGIGDFKYAPPSGFLALCSANLPEPAIGPNSTTQSDDYFNTVLYTGDSDNDVTVTNTFAADFVWLKKRSASDNHYLQDIVRGFGASKSLSSNTTGTEGFNGGAPASQNIVTTSSSLQLVSSDFAANSATYVAWTWKAGGTAVSNTDGSITSSVSANQDAGMSIISWTGNGTLNATIGHGLSATPDMVIVKNRSSAIAWLVWHKDLTDYDYRLDLQATSAQYDDGVGALQGVSSSLITLGSGNAVNQSTSNMIAYAFHDVDSYLKCGSYVGNGNADGTFVYTGFRPAWVMLKRTDAADNWGMHDSARGPYNVNDWRLYANGSNAEASGGSFGPDFLSNGFKLRTTNSGWNASGGTYIYLAFAEQPFKYANAR